MGKIFDSTLSLLHRAMDLRYKRHRLLTSNIANAETPGYRAKDIRFEAELRRQLDNSARVVPIRTNPMHIGSKHTGMGVQLIERVSITQGLDGNTVNLDEENVRLAENATMYSVLAKLIKHKFSTLMTAIKEGGK